MKQQLQRLPAHSSSTAITFIIVKHRHCKAGFQSTIKALSNHHSHFQGNFKPPSLLLHAQRHQLYLVWIDTLARCQCEDEAGIVTTITSFMNDTSAFLVLVFWNMPAYNGLCIVCLEFGRLNACSCGGGATCSSACYYLYWENSHKAYCTVAARRRVVREVLRPLLPTAVVKQINDAVGKLGSTDPKHIRCRCVAEAQPRMSL